MGLDPTTRPSQDQRLLTESLELVPAADELIVAFYDRLFAAHPYLRPMFPPVLDPQRERFLRAIFALVRHYDEPKSLLPAFAAMGRRHQRYGVGIGEYAVLGAALVGTLRDFAGTAWTPAYHGAWVRAYAFAAGSMLQAGALSDDEEEQPLAA